MARSALRFLAYRLIADSRPYVHAVLFAQQGTDITNAPEAVFLYSRLTLNESAQGFTQPHFLTTATPDITLTLLNEFLVTEHVHIHAVTKTKLALDRSTATCQGTLSFYDDTSADEYETKTAMLRDVCVFEVNGMEVFL